MSSHTPSLSHTPSWPRQEGWVARLRRFARGAAPQQRCDLCSAAIGADHRHLVEVSRRRLLCCCPACAVLFGSGEKYRLVPTRSRFLPDSDSSLSDAQWEALQIPIGIAFFVRSTPEARIVALYPGPAGVTESLLELPAWEEMQAGIPMLAQLEPDVEALLVNRAQGAREHYLVPVDQCFALAGIIRTHWHGLAGGSEAWAAIHAFFAGLRSGGRVPEADLHA